MKIIKQATAIQINFFVSIQEHMYVRAKEGKSAEALSAMQAKIQSYLPEYNDFSILTLKKDNLPVGYSLLLGLFVICSAICIMITIIGHYGAMFKDILRLFLKEYLVLVNIGNLLALSTG